MIDTRFAEETGHYCELPPIRVWDSAPRPPVPDGYDFTPPRIISRLTPGTRFVCDCGAGWIVRHLPGGHNRVVAWTERDEWQRETRRERRQRLGLRWWQRG